MDDGSKTTMKIYVHFWHPDGSFLLREGTDINDFSHLLQKIASAPTLRKKTALFRQVREKLAPPPEATSDKEIQSFLRYALFIICRMTAKIPIESASENVQTSLLSHSTELKLNGLSYVLCVYSNDPDNPLSPLLDGEDEPGAKESQSGEAHQINRKSDGMTEGQARLVVTRDQRVMAGPPEGRQQLQSTAGLGKEGTSPDGETPVDSNVTMVGKERLLYIIRGSRPTVIEAEYRGRWYRGTVADLAANIAGRPLTFHFDEAHDAVTVFSGTHPLLASPVVLPAVRAFASDSSHCHLARDDEADVQQREKSQGNTTASNLKAKATKTDPAGEREKKGKEKDDDQARDKPRSSTSSKVDKHASSMKGEKGVFTNQLIDLENYTNNMHRAPLHTLIPLGVMADSYKASHFTMCPESTKAVAYGEFRKPYGGDKTDSRFVYYGIRYLVENYLNRPWTHEDVEKADRFYSTHNAGHTPFPFPKHLFTKFVDENRGYFPIKLQALPEGTCAHIHVPVYQITAEKEYTVLLTFFETLLTQVWYPTTVATLSRRAKDTIQAAFDKSVDEEWQFLANFKLHDFGFRGCTCLEQSVLGGCAHLLNFGGTDTMSAAYYAQFELNNGRPVAESIPATEHSVMTSWRSEREAIQNMIEHHGRGVYSCVLDSYDYANCLYNILPQIKEKKEKAGGHMVLRPDSGDPVDAVLMGLDAAEKAFGADVNEKGFKVLRNSSVIQGDGINSVTLGKILDAALAKGYSAQNCTFGMGGGLLQKVDRDTMSFATKLSYIVYADGRTREVMKYPKTDAEKISLPGTLKVIRNKQGIPVIYPAEADVDAAGEDLLRVVYDCGPVENAFPEDFDTLKARVEMEWTALPRVFDPISPQLRAKIEAWVSTMKQTLALALKQ